MSQNITEAKAPHTGPEEEEKRAEEGNFKSFFKGKPEGMRQKQKKLMEHETKTEEADGKKEHVGEKLSRRV